MSNIRRLHASSRYSEASIHNGTVYLAGQVFLADLADFDGMNAVWDAWVSPDGKPSRATVEAQLARPGWRIEIVVNAAV